MDELKQTFAKNLVSLRTGNKMTQLELGDRLNYSDKTVSKWERGEAIPDATVLKDIAAVFNVSVDQLLSEDAQPAKPPKPARIPPALETPKQHAQHKTISKIAVAGLWLLSAIITVILWSVKDTFIWMILVYTVPLSLLLEIIFTALWSRNKTLWNFIYVSLFVISILACIYLSLLPLNKWMLFLLAVPAEIVIYFSFKLYATKRKKEDEQQ
jgi:transcriptional regulator with XRE-family HTH domain